MRVPLPIDPVLPELLDALRRQSCAVLRAPTGAGKTTRVPPALLDAGLAGSGRIILLEPRRLAARAAARRMATEREGQLGDEVGYQVRFDRCWSPRTRILAVTPGILLRFLQDDPFLERVGAFSSMSSRAQSRQRSRPGHGCALFSRRSVRSCASSSCRQRWRSRPSRLTWAAAPFVSSEGRLHPVEIRYEPRSERRSWPDAAARAAEQLLDRTDGDLLVFLPGLHEIRQTARHLDPVAQQRALAVLPLHGDLPAEQQDAALLPLNRRKIVLATNVAETSVTVEGITGVVDTGLARTLVFDPGVGLDRLRLRRSHAPPQSSGRSSRTDTARHLRFASERGRAPGPTGANRARSPPRGPGGGGVAAAVPGETDVMRFPWLEPPREAVVRAGARPCCGDWEPSASGV